MLPVRHQTLFCSSTHRICHASRTTDQDEPRAGTLGRCASATCIGQLNHSGERPRELGLNNRLPSLRMAAAVSGCSDTGTAASDTLSQGSEDGVSNWDVPHEVLFLFVARAVFFVNVHRSDRALQLGDLFFHCKTRTHASQSESHPNLAQTDKEAALYLG